MTFGEIVERQFYCRSDETSQFQFFLVEVFLKANLQKRSVALHLHRRWLLDERLDISWTKPRERASKSIIKMRHV